MVFETDQGLMNRSVCVPCFRNNKLVLVPYHTAPISGKDGWWIPAPELSYGDRPDKVVSGVLAELGIEEMSTKRFDTESFMRKSDWYMVWNYRCQVGGKKLEPADHIQQIGWFTEGQLPSSSKFAHGSWERKLAQRRLQESFIEYICRKRWPSILLHHRRPYPPVHRQNW